jgi:methionyl-tRNA formyltransferase
MSRCTPWTFARSRLLPYFFLSEETMPELAGFLQEVGAEVGCAAGLNQVLPQEALDCFPYGVLNLHPSLLPAYRGPFVWFWYYFDQVEECGVTVHRMESEVDAGEILAQKAFSIKRGLEGAKLMRKAITVGRILLSQALEDIQIGKVQTEPQPQHTNTRYARRLKVDEDLFPWAEWTIEESWHFLRGTLRWYQPVQFPEWARRVAWRAERYEYGELKDGTPGTFGLDWKGFHFCHPEGKVRLRPVLSWQYILILSLIVAFVLWQILL